MSLVLGIDIGTSKVAAAIVDVESRRTKDAVALLHRADLVLQTGRSEQSVADLFRTLSIVIGDLHADLRAEVAAIGVTGQMHGVVLWEPIDWDCTNLVSWQDRRCLEQGFLEKLRIELSDRTLYSGFGWATLAWLAASEPGPLDRFSCAGTVADLVVAKICGRMEAVTDPTNADSWGLWDLETGQWDLASVERIGVDPALAPDIGASGSHAGVLQKVFAEEWGVPEGTPVGIALGDNPASIYATIQDASSDIALNLGTGGQFAVVIDRDDRVSDPTPGLEFRPYVDDRLIALSTSLCGGQATVWIIECVERWFKELEMAPPSRTELYSQIDQLGLNGDPDALQVQPSFSGERHDPALRGRIDGLDAENFSLANLAAATAKGVLDGLLSRLPSSYLDKRQQVRGSGNAIRRSAMIRNLIERRLGKPLIVSEIVEEAASGAGLLVADRLLPV